MSKNIWVYIETQAGSATKIGLELITPAKTLASETSSKVIAILIGKDIINAANEAIAYGADSAIIIDSKDYEIYNTESYTSALTQLSNKYEPSVILIGATQCGKDFAPRAAARLNTGCISGAIDIFMGDNEKVVFTCASYNGSVLNHMVCDTVPQMATVRSSVFKKGEADTTKTGEIINETENIKLALLTSNVVEAVKEISEDINLEEAEVIVSGGRGMGSEENFKLCSQLAEVLGGVVGATRAPIEAGWTSRARQIGQSGKSVAPKLYIACGISGATQHVAGISGSDYIVAINKDEDASIFKVADVGIVGNAVEIIPIMIEEIKKIIS